MVAPRIAVVHESTLHERTSVSDATEARLPEATA